MVTSKYMDIESKKSETIENQKEQVLKEVTTLCLHRDFKEQYWNEKKKGVKKKEDAETLAHHKEQDLKPLHENIELKTQYYDYLCSLDQSENHAKTKGSGNKK